MDNENKWEYDYSSQDKNESGDTGYPNVGSSGMNTANQYNDPQPEPETAYTAPQTDNGAGGATPPVHPVQPQDAQPPKKKKKFNGKHVARSAVALVLAAAMGFCLRQFAPEKPGAGMLLVGAATAAALGSVQLWSFSRWHLPLRPTVHPVRIVPSPQHPAAAAA
mgnify:CR=1 FL=1